MRAVKSTSRTPLIIAGSVIVLAVVIIGGISFAHRSTQTAAVDSPDYTTLLPSGKNITSLGGWQRVSPQTKAPVYAYSDTINGIEINVSEQPLPDTFATNTDAKIAELATSYNATDKINANGTTVYIGTSAKGPQSVILAKNKLLILIKSSSKIDDKAWITYIDSLK